MKLTDYEHDSTSDTFMDRQRQEARRAMVVAALATACAFAAILAAIFCACFVPDSRKYLGACVLFGTLMFIFLHPTKQ